MRENKPLISILTPTYNSAKFLPRLLDSVLCQDYPNVEMIIIDDGSVDNTKELISNYIEKFKQRGFLLRYFYQENSGQSFAINAGLKKVNGDYLVWPDSDDFYSQVDSLSRLYFVLEKYNVGVVRCQIQKISEYDLRPIGFVEKYSSDSIENLFEDCLFCKNGYWYQPGGYMVRMKDVDQYIPDRSIYTEKRAGQNWQMMLPLLYGRECYTIKDKLYNVVVRETSHSHTSFTSYQRSIEMIDVYERTISSTLNSMSNIKEEEKQNYIRSIHLKYLKQKFIFSIDMLRKHEAKKYCRELKTFDAVSQKDFLKAQFPFFYKLYRYILSHF